MAIKPIVRYMILCEDLENDAERNNRIDVRGLITTINSLDDPPYPLLYEEFRVLLLLTEGRGQGEGRITIVNEESGELAYASTEHTITFPRDPLHVLGVVFRVNDCTFPSQGIYSVQFWYDGEIVEECPLRMR